MAQIFFSLVFCLILFLMWRALNPKPGDGEGLPAFECDHVPEAWEAWRFDGFGGDKPFQVRKRCCKCGIWLS